MDESMFAKGPMAGPLTPKDPLNGGRRNLN